MKIKTYIKKCNNKQLAQFLASIYFCDLNLDITLRGGNTIEKQAEYIYNNVFEREIPDIIQLSNTTFIDTKTRKVIIKALGEIILKDIGEIK